MSTRFSAFRSSRPKMSPHVDPVFAVGKTTIFSLPLEIRNQIYCDVYASDIIYPSAKENGLRYLFTDSRRGNYNRKLPSLASEVLALLLVNRQMLEEAAAIFYRKSQFQGHALEMSQFIKGIGRTRANLLTNLVLSHRDNQILKHGLLKCLLPLEGLKVVHLESWRHDFDGLKDELVRAGIMDLTGKFNIDVSNEYLCDKEGDDYAYERISYSWSCEKGATEWVGPEKTVAINYF